MFEVEKPRRFHYTPRFYDPEKEKWEALKKKYADRQEQEQAQVREAEQDGEGDELAYYEQRVRTLDRQKREDTSKLTWRDLFRKREMPRFNYQPRFSTSRPSTQEGQQEAAPAENVQAGGEAVAKKYEQPPHRIKIRRRFDIADTDYMKPIPGTKIILYCFIVFLLLMLIFGS